MARARARRKASRRHEPSCGYSGVGVILYGMDRKDWAAPPLVETPGSLGPALAGARLVAVEESAAERRIVVSFALAEGAGVDEATFTVEGATHRLGFAYLPPAAPLDAGLSPEEAMAAVGNWARTGRIVTGDPLGFGTACVVSRAALHVGEGFATLKVEGYGEDSDRLVWWELRVSGERVEAS